MQLVKRTKLNSLCIQKSDEIYFCFLEIVHFLIIDKIISIQRIGI